MTLNYLITVIQNSIILVLIKKQQNQVFNKNEIHFKIRSGKDLKHNNKAERAKKSMKA